MSRPIIGGIIDRLIASVDTCPWTATAGQSVSKRQRRITQRCTPLYTSEQRKRRDSSRWTLVQGILAPLQFVVFLASLGLVVRYLISGEGLAAATASVLIKTGFLYAIMITGSLWERDVFGRYLFARAFFFEDVVSMVAIVLHTAYVVALVHGSVDSLHLMVLALAAYAVYVVNAAQYVFKLRAARRDVAVRPARHFPV